MKLLRDRCAQVLVGFFLMMLCVQTIPAQAFAEALMPTNTQGEHAQAEYATQPQTGPTNSDNTESQTFTTHDESPRSAVEAPLTSDITLSRDTYASAHDDGVYSLTITYVDTNDTELRAPERRVLTRGEAWSVVSPELEEYALVDPSQVIMTGTASGPDSYLTYRVIYAKKSATYTIYHMKQLNGGEGYYQADVETHTGLIGSSFTATQKSYPHFKCITAPQDGLITADNNASLTLYYNQNPLNYAMYFTTNSDYIAPIVGTERSPLTAPADPSRTGYVFAGWDLDADGVADTFPTSMPNHNIYAQALWTPATASYRIDYYKQNVDGATYAFDTSRYATGVTQTQTPIAPAQDTTESGSFAYYVYDHETPVSIAADGSSVLNVYYNRVVIKVEAVLAMDDGTYLPYKTYEGLYGASTYFPDASDVVAAYQQKGGSRAHFDGWYNPKSNESYDSYVRTKATCDFSTKTVLFVARFTNGSLFTYYGIVFMQDIAGNYTIVDSGSGSFANGGMYITMTDNMDGFTLVRGCLCSSLYEGGDPFAITWSNNWAYLSNPGGSMKFWALGSSTNAVRFEFARKSYKASYYSQGTCVGQADHLYEQPFTLSDDLNGSTLTPPAPNLVFGGWYDNPGGTGSAIDATTQKLGGTSFYAQWVPKPVTVHFDAAGGTPSAISDQSLTAGAKATQPADPIKPGSDFIGWYYVDQAGHAVKWSFDHEVAADITLTAYWNPVLDTVSYTVIHQTLDGTELARESKTAPRSVTVTEDALAPTDARRSGYPYVDSQHKSLIITPSPATNVITFLYATQAVHTYTVHYVNADTGMPVLADKVVSSPEVLVDVAAPQVPGYVLSGDGEGYVSIHSLEYTFTYKVEPATGPSQPSTTGPAQPGTIGPVQPSTGGSQPSATGPVGTTGGTRPATHKRPTPGWTGNNENTDAPGQGADATPTKDALYLDRETGATRHHGSNQNGSTASHLPQTGDTPPHVMVVLLVLGGALIARGIKEKNRAR